MDTGPGDSQRPPGPQAGRQLTPQRPPALHIQRLVDRLMGHAHRPIIRKVEPQPVGDLLRAPRPRPATVRPSTVTPTDPLHVRAIDGDTVGPLHRARQPVLHIAAQLEVRRELGGLRAPRPQVAMPLCGRGAIPEPAATSRSVAPQLPGNRRRRTTEPARDFPHPAALGTQQRDLLPLGERQVPPRRRGERQGRHPATLPKPPDTDRGRHVRLQRRRLARKPQRDRRPEPLTILSSSDRRTARRAHHRPTRTLPSPNLPAHRNYSRERCDDQLNPPCEPRSE